MVKNLRGSCIECKKMVKLLSDIYDSTTHNSIYQYSCEMDIQIYRGSTACNIKLVLCISNGRWDN